MLDPSHDIIRFYKKNDQLHIQFGLTPPPMLLFAEKMRKMRKNEKENEKK